VSAVVELLVTVLVFLPVVVIALYTGVIWARVWSRLLLSSRRLCVAVVVSLQLWGVRRPECMRLVRGDGDVPESRAGQG
jgi:hypothetical protein